MSGTDNGQGNGPNEPTPRREGENPTAETNTFTYRGREWTAQFCRIKHSIVTKK